MAASQIVKAGTILLGKCVPSLSHNAAKIAVPKLVLDEYLLYYFRHDTAVFAYDPQKVCKSGDIVLIRELPSKMSTSITHEVLEVVYPHGDIVDPITNKKVVADQYRDQIEIKQSLFGKSKSAFDYEKAPPRGVQEDIRDFSTQEAYVKYHEFDEDDENKDQPYGHHYH